MKKKIQDPLLIDVTRLTKKYSMTGIDRVLMSYIDYFQNEARAFIFSKHIGVHILSSELSKYLFKRILSKSPYNMFKLIPLLLKNYFSKKSQKISVKNSILINIDGNKITFPSYQKFLKKNKIKAYFMFHDIIPLTHPEYCKVSSYYRHKQVIDQMLNNAHGLITNSDFSLKQLQKYTNTLKKALPPARSSLLGYTKGNIEIESIKPINYKYFVMVGTIEARKNHLFILETWKYLISKMREKTPKLVIIGKRGWECELTFNLLDRSPKLKGHVIELNNCNDQQLIHYVSHAQALLFPSFVEGYGLPLVEALSLNVPVIANELEVFREIAGNIPEFIPLYDSLRWINTIIDYSKDNSSLRQKQIDRIENYNLPSWEGHFDRVTQFILNN